MPLPPSATVPAPTMTRSRAPNRAPTWAPTRSTTWAAAMSLVVGLAACQPAFQTTSGADYLAARADSPVVADPLIRSAAAIEGDLRLPARIGLVRLLDGEFSDFPAAEAATLARLTDQAAAMGSFQPISLLLGSTLQAPRDTSQIDRARLVGARQHLDYLLVISHSMVANSTEVLFVDVRNGYPYASARALSPEAPLSGWAGARAVAHRTAALTEAIAPQLAQMLTGLAARASAD